MSISDSIVIGNQYVEQVDLPGEIYDERDFRIELIDEEKLSNSDILRKIVAGSQEPSDDFWLLAQAKYSFLASCIDKGSVKLWKLICDQAYLTELLKQLNNKPVNEHWVDIYRKSYQRLERMVETYSTEPEYINYGKIFDIPGTAQYISNELLLEQTRPISEARINPEIDGYSGIHADVIRKPIRTANYAKMRDRLSKAVNYLSDHNNEITGDHAARFTELLKLELENGGSPYDIAWIITETLVRPSISYEVDNLVSQHDEWVEHGDHYLVVPDRVLLPDHNGVMTEVSLVELQDNLDSWSGELLDPDHDWNEVGEMTSSSINQMETQELKITGDYYELRSRYTPVLIEIERRWKAEPLIRYANAENRDFVLETAQSYVPKSPLVQAFIKSLKMDFRSGVPAQDIAAIVMELPFEVTVNGNIDTVIDEFGDDILDSIVDPAGMNDQAEYLWEQDIESLHQANIAELERVADEFAPKHTAVFTTEAFKAVAEQQLPVNQAFAKGYDKFRSLSPAGSSAYRQALDKGLTQTKAMQAFYTEASKAGEYTPRDRFHRASKDHVIVLTASSGYTQTRELTWSLAKYKTDVGELFVPKSSPAASKRALYDLLCQKNWGKNRIAKLVE